MQHHSKGIEPGSGDFTFGSVHQHWVCSQDAGCAGLLGAFPRASVEQRGSCSEGDAMGKLLLRLLPWGKEKADGVESGSCAAVGI